LVVADRYLQDGAPDYLLHLLIEQADSTLAADGQFPGYLKNSWQYCLRLRDKRLAASLAIK
jgi:zinc finger FYVE domain-containing protein 26